MAHDVFISYSNRDKAVADAACAALERRRIRCWIAPRDVLPGVPYGEALINAIQGSRVMVLVFSASANDSPQVMREVERAVSKGIPIIPFRIENVPPSKSMEFFISAPHWLDALTPPLEQHLEKLADTIELLLTGKEPSPAPQARPPAAGPRRPAWLIPGLAALAVILLAALGWYALLRPRATPVPAPVVGATTPAATATPPAPTPAPGGSAATPAPSVMRASTEAPEVRQTTATPTPTTVPPAASPTSGSSVAKPPPASCPPAIGFEESIACSLDTALETDAYTFEARANDAVVVKALNTAGSEALTTSVWDSAKTRICYYTGSVPIPGDRGCALPGDGTYTIQIERADARQTQAIPYTLYIHRLNNPPNALPIDLDQSLSGSLDASLEIDAYTFEARANDAVVVKALNTAGSEALTNSVWDSTKTRICYYTGSVPIPGDRGCTLPGDGTYTIQVERADARQSKVIPYTISLTER